MLFGSFLGATLVTALFVIVPLYESSISAVDLLFTFRNAPAVEVDLRASVTTNSYTAEEAAAARSGVAEAWPAVSPWYPAVAERTLSREFRFIPPGPPADWLARAEAWRSEALAWRDEVAVVLDEAVPGVRIRSSDLGSPATLQILLQTPELLPPAVADAVDRAGELPEGPGQPPYPQPPLEATQSRIITAPDLIDHIELIEGEWPVDEPDPNTRADPRLRIVLGERLAELTGLGVGDESIIRPFISLPEQFEIVEIAGIARASDPTDPLWAATLPDMLIMVPNDLFDAWAAPITPIVIEEDRWVRGVRGFPGLTAGQSWYLELDRETVELGNVNDLTASVRQFSAELGRVSGVAVSTALPNLVESFDVRKTVFGAPILAMLALIVAGALYFLIYTSGLTLEREGPELALLRTRGAGRWQTVGLHLLQSGLIAIGAALLAPFVARFMVAITGVVPPMSELTGGEPLQVEGADNILPYVVAGAILTFATMGLAILPVARRSVLELRSMAARPPRASFWQRYFIDVFLVILAGILLFELRQRGIVELGDDPGLDPFAIIAPALFLVAGAFLLLRILPWVLRGVGWVMTRFQGMGPALAGWHLSRNPVPYGRLALLIWLTTGFGAFALTYAQTLESSYDDRAAYVAGSDVRVIADAAGFLDVPEGDLSAAVLRGVASPRLASRGAEMLAVRPDEFSAVTAWRPDYGGDTPEEVFGVLRPDGRAPPWGVELPAGTTAVRVDALHVEQPDADLEEGEEPPERDPLLLMVRVADARGRLWTFAGESFPTDGWGTVEVDLSSAAAINDGPAIIPEPLQIQAVWVERRVGGGEQVLDRDLVLFDEFRTVSSGAEVPLGEALAAGLEPQAGLQVSRVGGSYALSQILGTISLDEQAGLIREGEVTLWRLPTRGRLDPVPHLSRDPEPLLVILDPESAAAAQIDIGDEALYGIESEQIPGVRVGSINLVPTAFDPVTQGIMIADLDAVMQWLNGVPTWSLTGTLSRLDEPNELWVSTDDPDGTARFVVAQIDGDPDAVITAQGAATAFSSRPVQVGLVAVLFVGAVTGVVLMLAGVTGYVLVAVRRRAREMGVLRALGMGRRSVAGTFAVEQLVVLAVGAVVGVAAGVLLMRIVLPFLQLGETAEDIVPSVELVVNPAVLGLYLAIVTALLVGSVLWATRTVSARRLSEVLREVDR